MTNCVADLNTILQQLQSTQKQDQKVCIQGLQAYLDQITESGNSPSRVWGQHICSNVMVLLVDHFVKPALNKLRGKTVSIRVDVSKPFAAIIDSVHQQLKVDDPCPPFSWKQCRACHFFVKHVLEVLSSEVVVISIGQDYARLLFRILEFDVYRNNIPLSVLQEVFLRFTELLRCKDIEPEEANAYAHALSSICRIEHLIFLGQKDVQKMMQELTLAFEYHHGHNCGETGMKCQLHLMNCLTSFVSVVQFDFRSVALIPSRVIKTAIDIWHTTSRRDGWRLELLNFIHQQLKIMFGMDIKACSTTHVQLVHQHIFPFILSLLDSSRNDFHFVAAKETYHFPCNGLNSLFQCSAACLNIMYLTKDQVGTRGGAQDVDQNMGRPAKRQRLQTVVDEVISRASLLINASASMDSNAIWLHTICTGIVTEYWPSEPAHRLLTAFIDALDANPTLERLILKAIESVICRIDTAFCHQIFPIFVKRVLASLHREGDDASWIKVIFGILQKICGKIGSNLGSNREKLAYLLEETKWFYQAQFQDCAVVQFIAAVAPVIPRRGIDQLASYLLLQLRRASTDKEVEIVVHCLKCLMTESSGVFNGSDISGDKIGLTPLLLDAEVAASVRTGNGSAENSLPHVSLVIVTALAEVFARFMTGITNDDGGVTVEVPIRVLYVLLALYKSKLWLQPSTADSQILQQHCGGLLAPEITKQLSYHGVFAVCLVEAAKMTEGKLRRCDLHRQLSLLASLFHLVSQMETVIADAELCFWDDKQRYLGSLGSIARTILELVVQSSKRISPTSQDAKQFAVSAPHLELLGAALPVLQKLFRAFQVPIVSASSLDPLLNAETIFNTLQQMLKESKLIGEDSDKPQSCCPNVLLIIKSVAEFLLLFCQRGSLTLVRDFLSSLWQHYRFGLAPALLDLMNVAALVVPSSHLSSLADLCHEWITAWRKDDEPQPVFTISLRTASVSALCSFLWKAEPISGVKLGKLLFGFCAEPSYKVRATAATYVQAPFFVFSKPLGVFKDLLRHLVSLLNSTEEAKARTAISTLANCGLSCSAIAPDVIATFLEQLAVDGFAHKSIITAALSEMGSAKDLKISKFLSIYMVRVVYDWLFKWSHSIDSFPFSPFGYETLGDCITENVNLFLPVSVVANCKRDDSDMVNIGAMAMQRIFDLFARSADSTALLRQYFPQLVGRILALQAAEGNTELNDACKLALNWVKTQLGEKLYVDFMKRQSEEIISQILSLTVTSGIEVLTLPSIPFTSATKAVLQVAQSLNYQSITVFMAANKYDRAHQVLSALYHESMMCVQPDKRRLVKLLHSICENWFGKTVLNSPHVFRLVIRFCCSLFSDTDDIVKKGAADFLGLLLSTVDLSISEPHVELIGSTFVSKASDTNYLPEEKWKIIDLHLQGHKLWSLHQSQVKNQIQCLSQQHLEATTEVDGESAKTVMMLVECILESKSVHTANLYDDLANLFDLQRQTIASLVKTSSKDLIINAVRCLLEVASSAESSNVVRVAALNALRSLCFPLMDADESLNFYSTEALDILGWIGPNPLSSSELQGALKCKVLGVLYELSFDMNPFILQTAAAILRAIVSKRASALELVEKHDGALFESLQPFVYEKSSHVRDQRLTGAVSVESNGDLQDDALWDLTGCQESQWVQKIVAALLQLGFDEFYTELRPVVLVSPLMAKTLFSILSLLLATSKRPFVDNIKEAQTFLSKKLVTHVLKQPQKAPTITKLVLSTLNLLRFANQNKPRLGRSDDVSLELGQSWFYFIPAETIVDAAIAVEEWHFALLFLEYCCESVAGIPGLLSLKVSSGLSWLLRENSSTNSGKLLKAKAVEAEQERQRAKKWNEILPVFQQISAKLCDGDLTQVALRGDTDASRLFRYLQDSQWSDAMQVFDQVTQNPEKASSRFQSLYSGDSQTNVAHCLLHLGCSATANAVMQGWDSSDSAELTAVAAAAKWRQAQWTTDPPFHQSMENFDSALYSALNAVQHQDGSVANVCIEHAKEILTHTIVQSNVVETVNLFQMLRDMELAVSSDHREVKDEKPEYCRYAPLRSAQYLVVEPRDALHAILHQMFAEPRTVESHLLKWAERAMIGGFHSLALGILRRCSSSDEASQVKARILWGMGEQEDALTLLQHIGNVAESPRELRLFAEWAHDAQYMPTSVIVQQLLPLCLNDKDVNGEAHWTAGKLCDSLCTDIAERLSSSEYQTYTRSLEVSSEEQKARRSQYFDAKAQGQLTKEEQTHLVKRINQVEKDFRRETEVREKMYQDWNTYRTKAMHGYCIFLARSNETEKDLHAVYRLISLWLGDVPCVKLNPLGTETIRLLDQVPSFKFLPVIHQLVVRIHRGDDNLRRLVLKITQSHPYHVLWQIIALSNGDRYSPSEKKVHTVDHTKIEVVTELLNELRRNKKMALIISQITQLCEAYLDMAFAPNEGKRTSQRMIAIESSMKLMQIKRLNAVHVPTVPVAVDPSGVYDMLQYPTVKEFRPVFLVPGGVNAPKLIYCVTSSGVEEKQLLKSRDDMRQDHTIEQVFGLCNSLFLAERETRRRHLQVRDYVVVPLAPTCGLVQWVDKTTTLAEFLVESNGAHRRYYPKEFTHEECRQAMEDVAGKNSQPDLKLSKFREVCKRFTPCLHYFFHENYGAPVSWYESRRNYASSLSASSMVGYIVGLGDRHASNILIDKRSAELVHIDLGLAFEQGTLLPVPERIPFRLTRDVVDGLGITGVNGYFRCDSEASMRVLRKNKDLLSTALEVIVHDPLAAWVVDVGNDQNAMLKRENSRLKLKVSDADRAAARVRAKLSGYEGTEILGVPGHIQKLIQNATDDELLSQLFPGWSSWV